MKENRTLKHETTIHAGLILTILFFSLCTTAVAQKVPDVNQAGPYAVGHSWYIFEDDSRVTEDENYWPVSFNVFYPVDPEDIIGINKTTYYRDLDYSFWGPLVEGARNNDGPWVPNTNPVEVDQELEPAYLNPPVSDNGPFPLVMVSHGGGRTGIGMFYLGTRLASHGFTVAIINHYAESDFPLEACTTNIKFALSRLLDENETGEILYGAIDPNKVAAAGMSWGGTTSLALASGKDEWCFEGNCKTLDIDPRIKAVVTLDGSDFVFSLPELNRITVPVLSIGEDWENLDVCFPFDIPGFRARLHAATIQAHPSYRIDIHGVLHGAFQLSKGEIKRIITKYVIAFLKTNLSGESGYQNILTPGHALAQESIVSFFVTEKGSLKAGFFPEFVDVDNYDTNLYFIRQPGYDEANAYKEDE